MDELSIRRNAKAKQQFIERSCRYRALLAASAPQAVLDTEIRLVTEALAKISIPDLMDVMQNFEKLFSKYTQDKLAPPLGGDDD